MKNCELIEKCIFFNDRMANMPSTAEIFKMKFCKGEFAECARHIVCDATGRDSVPADLFPNQSERARKIVGTN